jgi:hypothetical protein
MSQTEEEIFDECAAGGSGEKQQEPTESPHIVNIMKITYN